MSAERLTVTYGRFRVHLYPEGGASREMYGAQSGWIVCTDYEREAWELSEDEARECRIADAAADAVRECVPLPFPQTELDL